MNKEEQEALSQQPAEVLTDLQLSILTKIRVKKMTPVLSHPKNSLDSKVQKAHKQDLARAALIKETLKVQLALKTCFDFEVSLSLGKDKES